MSIVAAMNNPIKAEILKVLSELSEIVPDVRLGQLITNLSYLAHGLSKDAVWDMEDEELLEAARRHLEKFKRSRRVGVA